MAPVNATDINGSKAFVPAKETLPEVETENGKSSKGYVLMHANRYVYSCTIKLSMILWNTYLDFTLTHI